MSDVKWIKISTSMFDDEKIKLLEQMPDGDAILVIWVKLLILAGKNNSRGEIFVHEQIPYTEESLAIIFGRKLNTVRMALRTFEKFKMIELLKDQTIVIVNWHKHQSVDGLEKLRQQGADRVRRFRASRQPQLESNVTRNVTWRDAVTPELRYVTLQKKSKIENSEKEERALLLDTDRIPEGYQPDTVVSQNVEGRDAKDDAIQYAEAKLLLAAFAKDVFDREIREADWRNPEKDLWLEQAVPIRRTDWEAVCWLYRLPDENKLLLRTSRRQSFEAFMANLPAEIDKAKTLRKSIGLNGALPGGMGGAGREPEPKGWQDAAFQVYGEEKKFPASFYDFPPSVQKEVLEKLASTATQAV